MPYPYDDSFPAASYDAWKTREPDWDDDPCAEVRHELDREIDERDQTIGELRSVLIEALSHLTALPLDGQRNALIAYIRETLGADQNAPKPVEDDIAF